MRNYKLSNTERFLQPNNTGFPEFRLNPLPMAITTISGEIIDINDAFAGFSSMSPDFHSNPVNLLDLLSVKSADPLDCKAGAWCGCTLDSISNLKECMFAFNEFETSEGFKLRVYSFIEQNILNQTQCSAPQNNHNHAEINKPSGNTQRLSDVQNLAGIGSWDIHFNQDIIIETRNLFELLQKENPGESTTFEDILHKSVIHHDDIEEYNKLLESVRLNKLTSYTASYRITDKNGQIRFIQNNARLEYSKNGELKYWTGIIHDVTSFRKTESLKTSAFQISQLIHSQHNLELLMKAIHQIISALIPAPEMLISLVDENDANHTYTFKDGKINPSDTQKQANGLAGYVLSSGEPLLASAAVVELMIAENIIAHVDRIPQSWIGIPLKTRESVIGILCLQSFTNEITYSEEEKTILLFVAEQIALATQKIKSEEVLIKAKNTAENSSRLKSSLLANMSHELRTPMTGILGFSEILNEELDDPRLKSMAGTIFKSAGRLMSTLNSIIDLSALEADKNTLILKPVNTRLMMQPLLKVAYSIASDKGLYLRTSIPPDIFVRADEKLLSQMIHHLIDNALKFTVDGGISISAYKVNKKSTEAVIRISDTGIGIAPEHHRMIFEEFRQVSEGFSRTFEGSGLGLSLCSKIARLLNARVWVDSVEGKGSDFYVELPVISEGISELSSFVEDSPAIKTHRLSRGPVPEVLIVEDNEINRRLAALYLREICNTEMAENGYVAIEKIKRRKYDAILMDINLGAGPDGLSIAHQVRSYEINKNTPIIAVTGYTMHGDREKLLSNGCSHYLPKPYDKQTLLKLFSGILYSQK